MGTLNPCRTCGQPPVVDDGSDYTKSIGCIPCDSWTSRFGIYDDKEDMYMEWNEGNPVGNPAPGIDYASMTPEERHAYCLNWVRGLGLTKERDIVTVVPGIEVYVCTGTMDKWVMIVGDRTAFRISESFGLDGIGDVYPVFAIIRAIERGELK